jgi:hypothetical protein
LVIAAADYDLRIVHQNLKKLLRTEDLGMLAQHAFRRGLRDDAFFFINQMSDEEVKCSYFYRYGALKEAALVASRRKGMVLCGWRCHLLVTLRMLDDAALRKIYQRSRAPDWSATPEERKAVEELCSKVI